MIRSLSVESCKKAGCESILPFLVRHSREGGNPVFTRWSYVAVYVFLLFRLNSSRSASLT